MEGVVRTVIGSCPRADGSSTCPYPGAQFVHPWAVGNSRSLDCIYFATHPAGYVIHTMTTLSPLNPIYRHKFFCVGQGIGRGDSGKSGA